MLYTKFEARLRTLLNTFIYEEVSLHFSYNGVLERAAFKRIIIPLGVREDD